MNPWAPPRITIRLERTTWMLDIWHRGKRYRIRRDDAGRLDTKERAEAFMSKIISACVAQPLLYVIAPYIRDRHVKLRALRGSVQGWHKRCRGQLLRSAKRRAAQKGVPFSLTADDIQIPDLCPALGLELVPTKRGHGFSKRDNSPSIDRLDPALGYVPGNVAVISWRANKLRSNASAAELKAIADWAQYAEGVRSLARP